VEIPESEGSRQLKIVSTAGERAGSGVRLGLGGEAKRMCDGAISLGEEPVKEAIDAAYAFQTRDDFLSDVTAFVEIDGSVIHAGFLHERVCVELTAPGGDAGCDSQKLDLVRREFRHVGGWRGEIGARKSNSRDGGFLQRGAEDVESSVFDGVICDDDIVGDDVAFESRGEFVAKFGGSFEEKTVGVFHHKNGDANFALRGEKESRARRLGFQTGDIDGELTVKVAEGV